MDLMTANPIRGIPRQLGHLRVARQELPGRVDDRTLIVEPPVPHTRKTGASIAPFVGTDGARLRLGGQDLLNWAVVDDGYRVAARPLIGAVDARRQVGAVLRLVGGLLHLGLSWKITGKPILPARKFDPLLSERRTGKGHGEYRGDKWSATHGTSFQLSGRPLGVGGNG